MTLVEKYQKMGKNSSPPQVSNYVNYGGNYGDTQLNTLNRRLSYFGN